MARFHSSTIDEIEFNNQKTIYKGREVTIAQKRALKAAETRKANAEAKKKSKTFDVRDVLPCVLVEIENTRKSVRNLKSICAFVDNGPRQWSRDYRMLMETFPEVERAFGLYHNRYNKIMKIVDELSNILKKSKINKSFFGVAENFGIEMQKLLDDIEVLTDAVSKSRCMDLPSFSGKEIIESSADGRRPGLKHILRNSTSTKIKTRDNLTKLAIALQQAYNDVVEYDSYGKRRY